jgi:hypothetical protein
MTAEVITKYKSMFEKMTRENQEMIPPHITIGSDCWCNPTVEEYAGHDIIIHNEVRHENLLDMDLRQLKDLKTVYEGFGFLGDAIDMIDARIKELTDK